MGLFVPVPIHDLMMSSNPPWRNFSTSSPSPLWPGEGTFVGSDSSRPASMRVASSVTRAATNGERPLASFAPSAEMTAVRIIRFSMSVALSDVRQRSRSRFVRQI